MATLDKDVPTSLTVIVKKWGSAVQSVSITGGAKQRIKHHDKGYSTKAQFL
jgi:hypothetical protein